MQTKTLQDLATEIRQRGPAPVERWNPALCGDMDMRIARNGDWYHQGERIAREALVRLFASILRRDADGEYYLVTPVEKWRIRVDDVPFVTGLLDVSGSGREQQLTFTTNVGDRIVAGSEHPLDVHYTTDGEPSPYLLVRGGLRALLSRALFIELAGLAEPFEEDGRSMLAVWSDGCRFTLGPAE